LDCQNIHNALEGKMFSEDMFLSSSVFQGIKKLFKKPHTNVEENSPLPSSN
jgi:hypothetical protein